MLTSIDIERNAAILPQGPIDVMPEEPHTLVNIADIREGQCRWPVELMDWCGREVESGKVYCPDHTERAKGKAYVKTSVCPKAFQLHHYGSLRS